MRQSNKFAATVIVPTYDRREMLAETIRSLMASNMAKTDYEVIVVDDGSSDGSLDVVRQFSEHCQIRYVWQQDQGYRAGRVRSLGIELAEGEVCIFLDCGIVASQNFVRAHVEAHAVPNRVVLGYVWGFNNTGDNAERLEAELHDQLEHGDVGAIIEEMRASGTFPDMREAVYQSCGDDMMKLPAPWSIGWSGNISVRRETFGDTIRFDENYRTWGAEDIDLSLTLYEAGCQFVICRDAAGIHLPHPKSHEVNSRSSRPNKIYLHQKFGRPETAMLIDVQSWDLNATLMAQKQAASG